MINLVPEFVAATLCGLLAARDPIWAERNLNFRICIASLWIVSPIAVVAARSFVEDELTIEAWYPYVAVMATLLLITRGRPALAMEQLWPEEARQDLELVARSERSVLLFCAVVVAGLIVWIAIELA